MRSQKKHKSYFFVFLLFAVAFFGSSVFSLSVEQAGSPTGYVNDFAGVLSADERVQLEGQIAQLRLDTGLEIGVALISDTGGRPISDFAFDLGNRWGIGAKETKNGVLVLVAVNQREWFIATAGGIEGTLPDALVHRIGEANFPSHFRQGDYFGGLSGAVSDIGGITRKDPAIAKQYAPVDIGNVFELTFWVFVFMSLFAGSIMGLFLFSILAPLLSIAKAPWFLGVLLANAVFLGAVFLTGGFFGLKTLFSWPLMAFYFLANVPFALIMKFAKWVPGTRGGFSGGMGGWRSGGRSSGGSHSFGGGGGFSGGGAGGRW